MTRGERAKDASGNEISHEAKTFYAGKKDQETDGMEREEDEEEEEETRKR